MYVAGGVSACRSAANNLMPSNRAQQKIPLVGKILRLSWDEGLPAVIGWRRLSIRLAVLRPQLTAYR